MTPRTLELGELRLPALDAQTGTLVVYGGKGMGKTNFAAVVAEEFARCALRFSWIDPVGVAWGLKHDISGRGPGVEVLILGGTHADIPIEPTAGAIVADLVVDEDVSVIIDISRRGDGRMWSGGEKIRFVRDYCVRLFERQGEQRRPIMQIIDEAGRFVPQQIPAKAIDIAECLGAIEQLVELGRNVGVGVSLITQRSARMNKSVSELADMMVAFRTVGPRSIDAIVDWFGEHVPRSQQHTLIEDLRGLDVGTALVVSPGWLKVEGKFAMRARLTFDSSSTPVAGKERNPTGKGATVDLAKYAERMSETIAKAAETDPRALQAKVRDLQRQCSTLERLLVEEENHARDAAERFQAEREAWAQQEAQIIERRVPFIPPMVEDAVGLMAALGDELAASSKRVIDMAVDLGNKMHDIPAATSSPVQGDTPRREVQPVETARRPSPSAVGAASARGARQPAPEGSPVGASDLRVLGVIVRFPQGINARRVAAFAGYSPRKSTIRNIFSRLRTAGLIEGPVNAITATADGIALVGEPDPMPTGPELVAHWLREVGESDGRVLKAIIDAHPTVYSVAELCVQTGYDVNKSTIRNVLSRLRSQGVLTAGCELDPDFVAAVW